MVGTSFSVKTGDSVEVKVLSGRVHISSATDQAGVEVDPNEEVVYTSHGVVKTRKLQQADVAALTANTTYNMKFGSATLAQVTESIAKKFDVSIKLEEEDAGACHITINLTGRSLEESLQMLTEVLNIRYKKHGEEITVSGKGC